MFFLQQRNYKQYLGKQFLTHFRSVQHNSFFCSAKTPLVLSKKIMIKNVVRRMSLWPLPHKLAGMAVKAGVTLEAALVLPIFIFFILNMFSVMEMLRLYGNMAFALNTVGGKVSLYGHAYEWVDKEWEPDLLGDVAFTYLYFKEEMLEILGEDYVEESPLANGKDGLAFLKCHIMENDLVEIIVTYGMEVPFAMGKSGEVRVFHCYQGRAWTGYNVAETDENCVYITENGAVYHSFEDCSYLKLMIRKVDVSEIEKLKNKEGTLYSICELCEEKQGKEVWVTETGEKYHTSEMCSGIKRTVYKVSTDVAKEKGYKLCSRCRDR